MVAVGVAGGSALADEPPPSSPVLGPGEFPRVTITSDLGTTEAVRFSSCTSTPTEGGCADGILTGEVTLRATRGAPLTVRVTGAEARTGMTVYDPVSRRSSGIHPDPTFAPMPPGTVQFTPPTRVRTGSDISVGVRWDEPGWKGEASYGLRLFFRGELVASRLDFSLHRRRAAPPLVRLYASHRGRVTLRWSSGGLHGRTTVEVPARRARPVVLDGLPAAWPHALRITARLQPAERGRPGDRAQHLYPAP